MTRVDPGSLTRSDLYYSDQYELRASGVFSFLDATYHVTFVNEHGVLRCLDTMMAYPDKPATPRFALRPEGYREERPEWPVCALRFDYDIERQVAAVVMLALDKDATSRAWMSRGTAGRNDVALSHDAWNPEDNRFPPESFITVTELRTVVAQWAFGTVLPPPAITWTAVEHETVGWS